MKFIPPRTLSPILLQAELYHLCREEKIKVCLDYYLPNHDRNMVVIKDGEVVLVVEFEYKPTDYQYLKSKVNKASVIDTDIIVCSCWSDIGDVFNHIKEIYKK